MMKIIRLINEIAGENTYLLVNQQAVLVIDPGSNTTTILERLEQLNKPVPAILLTHTHYDHIISVDAIRNKYHSLVYVSSKEKDWLSSPLDNLSGLARHDDMPDIVIKPADKLFANNKFYDIFGFQFHVRETPGHSHGSVSFVFPSDDVVFSGDALFRETIGRTDLPTGNFEELITSIKTELFTLPNHYRVYPGHGTDTKISHEKMFNPYLT